MECVFALPVISSRDDSGDQILAESGGCSEASWQEVLRNSRENFTVFAHENKALNKLICSGEPHKKVEDNNIKVIMWV